MELHSLVMLMALMVCLAPLSAATIHYTYDAADRLTGADYGIGRHTSYVYDTNGNLLSRTTATSTDADLQVTKTSDFTGRTVGTDITYTTTVNNNGPDTATGVVLTDVIPFGMLLKSISLSQGTWELVDRQVVCDIGILPVGGEVTLVLTATHTFEGSYTNTVLVEGNEADANTTDNMASRETNGLGPVNDSDGDGMPNWWETLNGLGGGSLFGANGDPDKDGVRNFEEWEADTDPRDPQSYFRIDSIDFDGGNFTLRFHTSFIRQYQVQFSTDSVNDGYSGFMDLDGTGDTVVVEHPNVDGNGFYQVTTQIPGP